MIVPTFSHRQAFVGLAILLALSSCAPSPSQFTEQLLGRWQRVGNGYLPEPYISAEYVEFRSDGQLVELLWDSRPQQAWTINVSHYAVSSDGRMEFSGNCWRGRDRYSCAHTYTVSRLGDTLRISDEQDQQKTVQYRRIADLEPEPPPTLAPPFPSPTPVS
jgi:hypothetical protein